MMNPSSGASIKSAMRYWGCAIQAGTQISGAFGVGSQSSLSIKELSQQFSPLAFACIPHLSTGSSLDWDTIINSLSNDAKRILHSATDNSQPSVRFDTSQKSVTLFMPGFEKAEIKLYQVCILVSDCPNVFLYSVRIWFCFIIQNHIILFYRISDSR